MPDPETEMAPVPITFRSVILEPVWTFSIVVGRVTVPLKTRGPEGDWTHDWGTPEKFTGQLKVWVRVVSLKMPTLPMLNV